MHSQPAQVSEDVLVQARHSAVRLPMGCSSQDCRGVVFSVLFHPKQLTVVSGGDDAEVRVWDLVDKSCIAVLKVRQPRRDACHPVAWQTRAQWAHISVHGTSAVYSAFNSTGCCAALQFSRLHAGKQCRMRLPLRRGPVDVGQRRAISMCELRPCVLLQGHFSGVTSLALAPDNWTLLSSSRDRTVHLWDLRTHAKIATVPIHEAVEGGRPCRKPACGPLALTVQ